jgi:hypothetical protein
MSLLLSMPVNTAGLYVNIIMNAYNFSVIS